MGRDAAINDLSEIAHIVSVDIQAERETENIAQYTIKHSNFPYECSL